MGKLKLRIHPLFILVGIYFAFTGKVFSFLTFTVCAVIHEMGHAITAQKLGYKLVNLTLMPFGAIISGDISGMKCIDEIKVSLAGPLLNLGIGVSLVAVWWVFPETYPYTELAVTASFSLFLVNLIPCFPLDGGRILFCLLCLYIKREVALIITKVVGIVFSVCLLALFAFSCFSVPNISILLFSIFMLAGIFDKKSGDRYVRLYSGLSTHSLRNGKEIKELAVNDDCTVKTLFAKMDGEKLYRLYVYGKDGNLRKIYEPHEVVRLIEERGLYDSILF